MMKTTHLTIAICILIVLMPISYCVHLDASLRQALDQCDQLRSKAFVLEDKSEYEESTNYNDGFSDGYESAKNEMRLMEWQSSILIKGFQQGHIKCYYVSDDGKYTELPLNKWIGVEFPLNKWLPNHEKVTGQ